MIIILCFVYRRRSKEEEMRMTTWHMIEREKEKEKAPTHSSSSFFHLASIKRVVDYVSFYSNNVLI